MHCALLAPKCYSATATILLGLFAVYGGIGNILYCQELFKFPKKGDWPFNPRFTIYMIMAVNSCYTLAAILGLFAFISQRLHIFFWASFIVMGTFAVQLIHGVTCVRASYEPMDGPIFSTFRTFQDDPVFMNWLLDFQWQYDCCGIKSYMDWQLFNAPFSKHYSVPDSCCDRKEIIPLPNCGEGLVAPNVSVNTARRTINIAGCGDKISVHYQTEMRAKGVIMLLAAFMSLIVGIFIFILHQKLEANGSRRGRRRRNSGYTEAQRLQRARAQRPNAGSQRNLTNANGNSNSSSNSGQNQTDHNGNTPIVPSYYKVNVAHKPPTGRLRPPRQDSTRNFQARNNVMQKNTPKYRVNPHHKHKYNQNFTAPNNRTFVKSRRGNGNSNEILKTKLEMLMHPVETRATSSATPNSSDLFPFYTTQPSTSACFQPSENFDPRIQVNRPLNGNNGADLKIAHYNSLPQVVTFPDGTVKTLYHYNTSHVHAQNLRRKHSQRQPPLFVTGKSKSKFPSLTITSTLATIHEENESVKSGNSQGSSTCTTNASSSPKSLSGSSSKQKQVDIHLSNAIQGEDEEVDSDSNLNDLQLQRTSEDTELNERQENNCEVQHQYQNHISSIITSMDAVSLEPETNKTPNTGIGSFSGADSDSEDTHLINNHNQESAVNMKNDINQLELQNVQELQDCQPMSTANIINNSCFVSPSIDCNNGGR